MNATLTERKPKTAKQLIIVGREVENNAISYYIQSGEENVYVAKIENGAAIGCQRINGEDCEGYHYSARNHKHCKHTDLALQNERERTNDTMQHVRDEEAVHSCIYCGHPMKYDGVCARCA